MWFSESTVRRSDEGPPGRRLLHRIFVESQAYLSRPSRRLDLTTRSPIRAPVTTRGVDHRDRVEAHPAANSWAALGRGRSRGTLRLRPAAAPPPVPHPFPARVRPPARSATSPSPPARCRSTSVGGSCRPGPTATPSPAPGSGHRRGPGHRRVQQRPARADVRALARAGDPQRHGRGSRGDHPRGSARGSFAFDFVVPDPGTHWFHPHTGLQLDRGLYAPFIIDDPDEPGDYDHEWVLVLDDWTDGVGPSPEQILADLQAAGADGSMMGGMGG